MLIKENYPQRISTEPTVTLPVETFPSEVGPSSSGVPAQTQTIPVYKYTRPKKILITPRARKCLSLSEYTKNKVNKSGASSSGDPTPAPDPDQDQSVHPLDDPDYIQFDDGEDDGSV